MADAASGISAASFSGFGSTIAARTSSPRSAATVPHSRAITSSPSAARATKPTDLVREYRQEISHFGGRKTGGESGDPATFAQTQRRFGGCQILFAAVDIHSEWSGQAQRDRVVDLVGGDVDVETDGLVRRFRVRTQFFRIDIEADDNPACCFVADQSRRRNNREKECFEESARVSRGGQPE